METLHFGISITSSPVTSLVKRIKMGDYEICKVWSSWERELNLSRCETISTISSCGQSVMFVPQCCMKSVLSCNVIVDITIIMRSYWCISTSREISLQKSLKVIGEIYRIWQSVGRVVTLTWLYISPCRRRSSLLNRSQSSLSRGEEQEESHSSQLGKSDVVLTFQIEVTT